jgi:hypothetical protein
MLGETLGDLFRRRGHRRRDQEIREVRRTLEIALGDRPRRRRNPSADPGSPPGDSERVIDLAAIERDEQDIRSPLVPPSHGRTER